MVTVVVSPGRLLAAFERLGYEPENTLGMMRRFYEESAP